MSAKIKLLFAISVVLALGACKKEEPVVVAPEPAPAAVEPAIAPPAIEERPAVEVAAVSLGTAVGADQKVVSPATRFSGSDVIYIAIDTKNAEKDVFLSTKWMAADGKVIHEEGTQISPEGDATTNFKFSADGGLAAGKYKVEVSLKNTPVQTVEFDIE